MRDMIRQELDKRLPVPSLYPRQWGGNAWTKMLDDLTDGVMKVITAAVPPAAVQPAKTHTEQELRDLGELGDDEPLPAAQPPAETILVCPKCGYWFRGFTSIPTHCPNDGVALVERAAAAQPGERKRAVTEARRALRCLYLKVPESIANDVRTKVEAAFTALRAATPDKGEAQ